MHESIIYNEEKEYQEEWEKWAEVWEEELTIIGIIITIRIERKRIGNIK